jgi:hypothetical protein
VRSPYDTRSTSLPAGADVCAVDGCNPHVNHDFAWSCRWVRSVAVDEFLWAPWLGEVDGFHVVDLLLSRRCQGLLRSPVEGLFLARL